MSLLELEELAHLGVFLNFWVKDFGLGYPLAVEVVVPGGETYFGLAKGQGEETVLTTPFGGCEMTRKGCELLGKVLDRVEGGLPHDCTKWDGLHPPFHHFGDGGHGRRYCRHVCTVCALKRIK